MKINRSHRGISQSIDLFIIIAAVLACGIIVTNALLDLINANASNTSIELSQTSLAGSVASTSGGSATLTFTIKNAGTTTISLQSTDLVKLGINSLTTTTTTSCTDTVPLSYSGSSKVTWGAFNAQTSAGANQACTVAGSIAYFTWAGPSTAVTVSPGGTVTFSVSPSVTTSSGSVGNPITTGNTYTLTISGPSLSITENVVSS